MDETASYLEIVDREISGNYDFCEVRNAAAIIASTSPNEWAYILYVL